MFFDEKKNHICFLSISLFLSLYQTLLSFQEERFKVFQHNYKTLLNNFPIKKEYISWRNSSFYPYITAADVVFAAVLFSFGLPFLVLIFKSFLYWCVHWFGWAVKAKFWKFWQEIFFSCRCRNNKQVRKKIFIFFWKLHNTKDTSLRN